MVTGVASRSLLAVTDSLTPEAPVDLIKETRCETQSNLKNISRSSLISGARTETSANAETYHEP